MALNKEILGQALYDRMNAFNEKTNDELISEYGGIDNARLAMWKAQADEIINHFTGSAVLHVPGLGLVAPSTGGAVTGEAGGTIE